MPFCQFCGKQYPDGGSCDCAEAQSANSGNVGSSYNPYSENSGEAAAEKSNPIKNLIAGFKGGDNKNQTLGLVCIGVAALIVLIIIINILGAVFGGGYKKPIKDFVKGFNNADSKKLMESILPDSAIDDLKDEYDDDWKDMLEDLDDDLEDALDDLEDEYGKHAKLSVDFLDKKKASKSDLEELEEIYDEVDATVKKAYKVKVEMTFKGKDDEESEKLTLYVVKIKGDGWKLAPYDDASSFMYLTGMSDLF